MEEGYQKEFNDERRSKTAINVYEGTYQDDETGMRGYVNGRVPDLFISELSPFKACRRGQEGDAQFVVSKPYGKIDYDGPLLTTFDEDLLFAILETRRHVKPDESDEYKSCTFKTTYSELIRLMGLGKNQRTINRVVKRLRAMHKASIMMSLPETKDGLWRNTCFHIIEWTSDYGKDDKDLLIRFSVPFMLLYAMRKHYSTCLKERASVRSSSTKRAITYLNYLTHFRRGYGHKIDVEKFAKAINWSLPVHKGIRRRELLRLQDELKTVGIDLSLANELITFKKCA